MSTMSYTSFLEAFHNVLPLQKSEVRGQLRAFGGAQGVGIDLLLANFNADYIFSAALQLAYIDGSREFDEFSLRCLRCFLTAVLGSATAANAWITASFQHLQADGVTSCATTHDGFALRLLQQKPYQMFLVTATDESAPDTA